MTETLSEYELNSAMSDGVIIEELKRAISILPYSEREELENQIKNELDVKEQKNMFQTILRVFGDEVLFLIELEKRRSNMAKIRLNSKQDDNEFTNEFTYELPKEDIKDS